MSQKDHPGQDEDVEVDAALESDIGEVERSIDVYLRDPSIALRGALAAGLERLDQQIDLSDEFESEVIGSGALGFPGKGSVIGETGPASPAEDIPGDVLQAQTALIKAAKKEVAAPTAATLAGLRTARDALAAVRPQES